MESVIVSRARRAVDGDTVMECRCNFCGRYCSADDGYYAKDDNDHYVVIYCDWKCYSKMRKNNS